LQCRDRDISQPHRLLNEIAAAIVFAQAATVLLDPLAVTVFDAAHSQNEERWFTLGTSSEGKLLAVSHTYHQPEGAAQADVRIISAREATRRERHQFENEPR
jgi:uncharacterized DUF497 family protein